MSNIYYLKLANLPTCCDMCKQYNEADGRVWCPIMGKIGDKDVVCCPIIPADKVVERKSGKWREDMWITTKGYSCSECNGFATHPFNFCPNCGADLRERSE